MRRSFFMVASLLLLTTTIASAAAWHRFSDRSFSFTLSYPADWHGTVGGLPGVQQLILERQGKTQYAMTVLVLNIKPGKTPRDTVQRVIAHGQTTGGVGLGGIHWSAASIGGRAAMSGVTHPPTEGGVNIAMAVYIVGWRTHIYEVALTSFTHPAPTSVGRFPAVYRQILRTWRFV